MRLAQEQGLSLTGPEGLLKQLTKTVLETAWLRLLCLSGDLAKAEPKTLHYRILHTSARIIRGQHKRTLRIPETWP